MKVAWGAKFGSEFIQNLAFQVWQVEASPLYLIKAIRRASLQVLIWYCYTVFH